VREERRSARACEEARLGQHGGHVRHVCQRGELHAGRGDGHGAVAQDAVHEPLLAVLGGVRAVDVQRLEHRERQALRRRPGSVRDAVTKELMHATV